MMDDQTVVPANDQEATPAATEAPAQESVEKSDGDESKAA